MKGSNSLKHTITVIGVSQKFQSTILSLLFDLMINYRSWELCVRANELDDMIINRQFMIYIRMYSCTRKLERSAPRATLCAYPESNI